MPGPLRRPHPGNLRQGREGLAPRAVVVHTTDGTFDGTVRWFASADSGVSAHHLVRLDGHVVHLVDESDTAFHCGSEPRPDVPVLGPDAPNRVTIGIEFDDAGQPHDIERPSAQYRAGAEVLAAAHRRWDIPLDRDHVLAHNVINRDKTCPGNLDIDRLLALARRVDEGEHRTPTGIVVLLPARNAAHDLPDWLAGVERFADAVVALDDGSTDDTAAILDAHPLVKVLLHNPRRDTYEGWDDSANRNRLLAAAHDLHPDWILSLDADERIPADDATALRHFLATDALPGLAYGLQCFRMWGDRCERAPVWVYRLFSAEPDQRFPTDQLHFDPVPTSIDRARHVRTSLRVRHVGSDSEEKRAARVAKYLEADPDGAFPTGHGGLDDTPHDLVPWVEHRDPETAVVLGGRPLPSPPAPPDHQPKLVVLLPARNAAHDLPDWLAGVERFADAVVALDDGSTDDTAAILDAHPLVKVLLHNPRRDTYEGWDDSAKPQPTPRRRPRPPPRLDPLPRRRRTHPRRRRHRPAPLPRHRRPPRPRIRDALPPDDRRRPPLRQERARRPSALRRRTRSAVPRRPTALRPGPHHHRPVALGRDHDPDPAPGLGHPRTPPGATRQVRPSRPRRRAPGRLRPPARRAGRPHRLRTEAGRPAGAGRRPHAPVGRAGITRAQRHRHQPRRRGPHRADRPLGRRAGVPRALRDHRRHQRHRRHRVDRATPLPRRAPGRTRPRGAPG